MPNNGSCISDFGERLEDPGCPCQGEIDMQVEPAKQCPCTRSPAAPAARAASSPSRRRPGAALWAALPLLFLAAFAAFELPLCPSRLLLGVPCPGCGLTRATLALLRGDLEAVWTYHPLAPIMAPLVVGVLGKPILEELGWIPKGKVWLRLPNGAWAALAVAFFGLYLLRVGGMVGGLPDPVDPRQGLIGQAVEAIVQAAG